MAEGWICPRCKTSNAPAVRNCSCTVQDGSLRDRIERASRQMGTHRGFDPSRCPCNPALGGSGICGCVQGSQTICSVRVS